VAETFPTARVDVDCAAGAAVHRWTDVAEIVTFGFPCQAFSQAKEGCGPGPAAGHRHHASDGDMETLRPLTAGCRDAATVSRLPMLILTHPYSFHTPSTPPRAAVSALTNWPTGWPLIILTHPYPSLVRWSVVVWAGEDHSQPPLSKRFPCLHAPTRARFAPTAE
jgi:hypothetical protein